MDAVTITNPGSAQQTPLYEPLIVYLARMVTVTKGVLDAITKHEAEQLSDIEAIKS